MREILEMLLALNKSPFDDLRSTLHIMRFISPDTNHPKFGDNRSKYLETSKRWYRFLDPTFNSSSGVPVTSN